MFTELRCLCSKNLNICAKRSLLLLKDKHPLVIRYECNSTKQNIAHNTRNNLYYTISIAVGFLGLSYCAVPLYKRFCQITGLGGNSALMDLKSEVKVQDLPKVQSRPIRVYFNADTNSLNEWNFQPLQKTIEVIPGETALAFYTAENKNKDPVIGIATYTILPYVAAQYFHKIQCFCFEEQLLNPHEKVDLPVFFYVHPDYVMDPALENVDNIVLSYTFFQSKDNIEDFY